VKRARRSSIAGLWWLTLAGLLLLGRLASPPGFMASSDHGRFAITACPDDGPTLASAQHHHSHGKNRARSAPCPFATGSAAAALPQAQASPERPLLAPVAADHLAPVRFARLEARRDRPPSRAPPPRAA
jgi:hypothetical protein